MDTKEMPWPPPGDHYHIKTHGGLGDIIWLFKKLTSLPLPVYLSISEENRARPRRSGILADHLPNVIGWRFDGSSFATDGGDWPAPSDPCCAIGKTWKQLGFETNTEAPYRLECNRWLESGRRIERWLPDLGVQHHYPFGPPGLPRVVLDSPRVIFHLAGWPDVHDLVWRAGLRLFRGLAKVYVVGGSYDRRPRVVVKGTNPQDVVLLEDLPWADLYHLIAGADYVFGHASGFTALADAIGVKRGVIVNPRSVPNLVGTWNDNANSGLLYVSRQREFETAVYAAHKQMSNGAQHTWPPHATRGHKLVATDPDSPRQTVKDIAVSLSPRTIGVFAAGVDHPDWIGSAILDGVYGVGQVVDGVTMVDCRPEAIMQVHKESLRTSRRPTITTLVGADAYGSRLSGFDMVVVYTDESPTESYRVAQEAWRSVSPRGTLVVGGPRASAVCSAVATTLRVKGGAVENATGWYFLHRRT